MITEASKVNLKVRDTNTIRSVLSDQEVITVDWGDGNIEPLYLDEDYLSYLHEYSDDLSSHIIKIKEENITDLDCSFNQLISLDVSGNEKLKELRCHHNYLTNLLINNNKLEILDCSYNELINLDLRGNDNLIELYCNKNQLIDLNIRNQVALKTLVCYGNKLKNLEINNNTSLTEIQCGTNELRAESINNLFLSLPNNIRTIDINCNPGTNTCNRSIATNKGWIVE